MKEIVFLRLSPIAKQSHPHPKNVPIPFEIAYLINLLPKNVKPTIIDTYVQRLTFQEIIQTIDRVEPFVLLVSAPSVASSLALKICAKMKRQKITTVAYGPHVSFSLSSFLFDKSPVDYCLVGEIEETFIELLNAILKQKGQPIPRIKGIAFWDSKKSKIVYTPCRPLIKNLDILPFMAHRYFLKKGEYFSLFLLNTSPFQQKWGFLLSSRGCPFSCSFCSPAIRNSFGKSFRAQSPERVVNEMHYLIKNFDVNCILFEDDIFTCDKERVQQICEQIIRKKLKIKWAAQTRVDFLDSKLLSIMKRAGCSCITLGVESGSNELLKRVGKKITRQQIEKVVLEAKKLGINLNLNFIFGFPGETLSQAKSTLAFAKKLNPLFVHFHYLTPYPGTKIYEEYKSHGNLPTENLFHHEAFINLSRIPDKRYKNLLREFYLKYYLSPHYLIKYLPSWLWAFIRNSQTRTVFIGGFMGFLYSRFGK